MARFVPVLAVAAGLRQRSLASIESDVAASPVQKVVTFLENMEKELEGLLEEDRALFKQNKCWCNSNTEEKTDAIKLNAAREKKLQASIEEGTGRKDALEQEIADLEADMKEKQESLDSLTKQREKESAAFRESELDDTVNVRQLKAAITVLSRNFGTEETTAEKKAQFKNHNLGGPIGGTSPGFLQTYDVNAIAKLLEGRVSHTELMALKESPYSGQSGEIVGILKQMLEEMSAGYAEAKALEEQRAADFKEARASLVEGLQLAKEQHVKKSGALADTAKKLAEDKEELDITQETLTADREFMANLTKTCSNIDEQWAAREKLRNEELRAVGETIGILTSEEAKDTFHSTMGFESKPEAPAAFIQTSAYNMRQQAATLLDRTAVATRDNALSLIASSVRLDAFTRVHKAIDDMVSMLKQEMVDEVKHRDYCIENIQKNEMEQTSTQNKLEDLKAKQAELSNSITNLGEEIKTTKSQYAEAKVQLEVAGKDRIEASKEFQRARSEAAATIRVLNMAVDRLAQFYEKKEEALLQQKPPAQLTDYSSHGGATAVLSMLRETIGDQQAFIKEATNDEQAGNKEYYSFIADSNTAFKNFEKKITALGAAKAEAENEFVVTKETIKSTFESLEDLNDENIDLHTACDFTLKNFEIRQENRQQEIDALGEAKGILSGAQ